ncbi:hypothetical protein JOB18_041659 [Solea senegalensis]|uniref:Uncharacterized protein n=1 Tax=Solea senegalensis TaxID=28829 RepID=A0AAV6RUW8_SOLSE|nr:hypothetical protein JOB18_041659 [Solea senegalensis]
MGSLQRGCRYEVSRADVGPHVEEVTSRSETKYEPWITADSRSCSAVCCSDMAEICLLRLTSHGKVCRLLVLLPSLSLSLPVKQLSHGLRSSGAWVCECETAQNLLSQVFPRRVRSRLNDDNENADGLVTDDTLITPIMNTRDSTNRSSSPEPRTLCLCPENQNQCTRTID